MGNGGSKRSGSESEDDALPAKFWSGQVYVKGYLIVSASGITFKDRQDGVIIWKWTHIKKYGCAKPRYFCFETGREYIGGNRSYYFVCKNASYIFYLAKLYTGGGNKNTGLQNPSLVTKSFNSRGLSKSSGCSALCSRGVHFSDNLHHASGINQYPPSNKTSQETQPGPCIDEEQHGHCTSSNNRKCDTEKSLIQAASLSGGCDHSPSKLKYVDVVIESKEPLHDALRDGNPKSEQMSHNTATVSCERTVTQFNSLSDKKKSSMESTRKKFDRLRRLMTRLEEEEEEKKKLEDEIKKLVEEKKKLEDENKKLVDENKKLDGNMKLVDDNMLQKEAKKVEEEKLVAENKKVGETVEERKGGKEKSKEKEKAEEKKVETEIRVVGQRITTSPNTIIFD